MCPFPRFTLILSAILFGSSAVAQDGFRPLFNGQDLTGWDGNPALWTVEDGCITGKTQGPETLAYNQFLIWRGGRVKNFELRAKVKQTGNNTGIQYRSKELPENGPWSVGGYQCDIHPATPNNAMVYEERGRGIMTQNGQTVIVDPKGVRWQVAEHPPVKVDISEWHEYTIIAQGNRLIHKVDGEITIDLTDHEASLRSLEGLLAFQIHRGPAMTVQIKDVVIRDLPDGGEVPFESFHISSGARLLSIGKKTGPGEAKGAGKGKRPAAVGPAIGENIATPVARIKVAKGFQVELIYSVPGEVQGSWVNLCEDDRGRVYVSDQYGGLYRFTPPAPGLTLGSKDVTKLSLPIRAVNGMLFAFGALYVGVNDYEGIIPGGLYRIRDRNGDGELDDVELLRAIESKGDHGVHAVVPTPDGKGLYLVCGNGAKPTEFSSKSAVPAIWGEDHLLPRMPDGRGFMRTVMAPGGIIYRVSPDAKDFEVFASGFRNIFDASVNREGELFTYDADMEYDFNTSWYRPTRICHVVSGGEFGWRNGAGKRPSFYPDNLPPVIDIGPGSPTGTTFGYGAKFPAKYQNALFALDWSWGKLYAIHLDTAGSSYKAIKEEFISGSPLPLTDAIVRREDGALYFTIGGRRVQSGVYRVTYTGSESVALVSGDPAVSAERDLRHQLESFHGVQSPMAIEAAWPHLGSADRQLRWAARTALEHQPWASWADKVWKESDPAKQVEAMLALARCAGVCPQHRLPDAPTADKGLRGQLLNALLAIDFSALTHDQQLTALRALQIVLNRFDRPDDAVIQQLVSKLDPIFPAKTFELNWLLCETLVSLQSPHVAAKAITLMAAAPTQEEQIEYARSLRMLEVGWTPETRKSYLEWFLKAANYRGGASFDKFIEFIRTDAVAHFSEDDKATFADLLAKKPERISAVENAGAMFIGRNPTLWTLEELSSATRDGMKARSFDNGRKMFGAAACFACHRFGNEGGMTGPDLSGAGGRYSPHDLLDQIINPSKVINEQFVPSVLTKNDGSQVIGVVVNLSGDSVTINTDLADPNQRTTVDRKEVKSIEPSPVSPMPPMLLAMLTKEEVLDLVAYVLSGGDRLNAMFQP
jgi:putative heme-binding domain-containing protein